MATSLTIQILTDASKAIAGLDQVEGKTTNFGSKMTAVAGAIGGAFSIDKIKGWAEGWIQSGLDASRALKDVKLAFGDSADAVDQWGEKAAGAFGMTAAEAEKAAAKVGIALEGYGFSQQQAALASGALVQRSAEIAKVFGTDQAEVLGKVETAMRGRTAGLKDYGVQIDKGSSSTEIFNAFMADTANMAGQADTPLGTLHATFGNMSEQLGQALIPAVSALIPLIQTVADWATNNKGAFDAIVIVLTAIALAFGVAATAAGIFAVVSWSVLWPILLVVAGVAALTAAVIFGIKYWHDLVQWFHDAVSAVQGVIDKLGPLVLLFGPIGAAILVIENFGKAWNGVKTAVDSVYNAIKKVVDFISNAASAVGNFLSKIPGVGSILSHSGGGGGGAPAGPTPYGAAPYAAPVTFAPQINISADVSDPMQAGRRIVSALETWTAANGRRRIAALVGP